MAVLRVPRLSQQTCKTREQLVLRLGGSAKGRKGKLPWPAILARVAGEKAWEWGHFRVEPVVALGHFGRVVFCIENGRWAACSLGWGPGARGQGPGARGRLRDMDPRTRCRKNFSVYIGWQNANAIREWVGILRVPRLPQGACKARKQLVLRLEQPL